MPESKLAAKSVSIPERAREIAEKYVKEYSFYKYFHNLGIWMCRNCKASALMPGLIRHTERNCGGK
jgi:hypothetical protein